MCAKHKKFFTDELLKWKSDINKANSLGNILNSADDNVSSADVVDQASSYTDKSVEMKALNRSRKLISKINAALQRLKMELMVIVKRQSLLGLKANGKTCCYSIY